MPLFYYPNRPTLVPPDPLDPIHPAPDFINSLENLRKYVGEFKWNGDNTTILTDDLSFFNREGKRLCYTPHPEMLKELKQFPKGCSLNAELMHRHTKVTKDLLILHCAMAWEGKLLLGKTWDYSRQLLEHMGLPQTSGTSLDYKQHVLLAEDHDRGFWKMFQDALACDKSIEGIILKDPTGKFKFSTSPITDVPWMIKIRKPSKNYPF